jgi:hypothetical protein
MFASTVSKSGELILKINLGMLLPDSQKSIEPTPNPAFFGVTFGIVAGPERQQRTWKLMVGVVARPRNQHGNPHCEQFVVGKAPAKALSLKQFAIATWLIFATKHSTHTFHRPITQACMAIAVGARTQMFAYQDTTSLPSPKDCKQRIVIEN